MLIWMRGESRENEARAPMTPKGASDILAKGWRVVVEDAPNRCIPTTKYHDAGCEIVENGSWITAPKNAIILGLKELPKDDKPLHHRHIMFGHAFKGQTTGRSLLDRLKMGGGKLLDLEYLVDDNERRVAAFGYWAGYAGAALSVMAWGQQQRGKTLGVVSAFTSSTEMARSVRTSIDTIPTALIIGAMGRVGSGAMDLCVAAGISPTAWDIAQTAHGGPFPEVLTHDILLNCILAHKDAPVFVAANARTTTRKLSMIGDIACDPESDFSPIKVYNTATTWDLPTLRSHETPPLDVMAIDNLPSLLPVESTYDFASQLLQHLLTLDYPDLGTWGRAQKIFAAHL